MPGATSWAWHSFNIISTDAPSRHTSVFVGVDSGCEGETGKIIIIIIIVIIIIIIIIAFFLK